MHIIIQPSNTPFTHTHKNNYSKIHSNICLNKMDQDWQATVSTSLDQFW